MYHTCCCRFKNPGPSLGSWSTECKYTRSAVCTILALKYALRFEFRVFSSTVAGSSVCNSQGRFRTQASGRSHHHNTEVSSSILATQNVSLSWGVEKGPWTNFWLLHQKRTSGSIVSLMRLRLRFSLDLMSLLINSCTRGSLKSPRSSGGKKVIPISSVIVP